VPSVPHLVAFCVAEFNDLNRIGHSSHNPSNSNGSNIPMSAAASFSFNQPSSTSTTVHALSRALLYRLELELLMHCDTSFDDIPPPKLVSCFIMDLQFATHQSKTK
jgi:hypothetical protein